MIPSKVSVGVQSAGRQEPSERGLLCELAPADPCWPDPEEQSLGLPSEDTACVRAQRSQRARRFTADRSYGISSLEELAEQAGIPVGGFQWLPLQGNQQEAISLLSLSLQKLISVPAAKRRK